MKFINGTEASLLEVMENVFERVSVEVEVITEGSKSVIKYDDEAINPDVARIIDCVMQLRINAGIMKAEDYTVTPEYVANMFAITANNAEKVEIIRKDILGGARIPEENIIEVLIPVAPGMVQTMQVGIIALDLNDDQVKAIELSAKTAKIGLKVTNATRKASMVAGATAGTLNRVGREVVLAGTEIGATVGVGLVKTGIEATAIALNIGLKDLNPRELSKGENVQALSRTIKGLFKKDDNSKSTVGNGFASL